MAMIRAILIDPKARTLTEVRIKSGYKNVQKAIGCRSFTTGSRPLCGSLSEGFDAVYCSDDDLEDRGDPRFWFQVDADCNPPSSDPIAGRGLVLGADPQGADCDARISVEELAKRITFTQRKFRGFEIESKPGEISVSVKAPIIDGADEEGRGSAA
jgi:hypothetical protein